MIYIILVILHFIFDWILQPRHIAKAKGKTDEGINAVLQHTLLNILPFSICFILLLMVMNYLSEQIIIIVSINLFSHLLIDIFLPKGKTERQIINWLAVDQILHLTILFILINYGKILC